MPPRHSSSSLLPSNFCRLSLYLSAILGVIVWYVTLTRLSQRHQVEPEIASLKDVLLSASSHKTHSNVIKAYNQLPEVSNLATSTKTTNSSPIKQQNKEKNKNATKDKKQTTKSQNTKTGSNEKFLQQIPSKFHLLYNYSHNPIIPQSPPIDWSEFLSLPKMPANHIHSEKYKTTPNYQFCGETVISKLTAGLNEEDLAFCKYALTTGGVQVNRHAK